MFRNLQGEELNRLLSKFTENELEKVDRLVDLHVKYSLLVRTFEEEHKEEGVDEETKYLDKLDAGFFTLQLVDLTVAFCVYLQAQSSTDDVGQTYYLYNC